MAMFQQPTRPAGTVHVEFRAGKMEWDGRMVTADKKKGKIILYTSEDEQLTHLQWYDREKKETSMDLIVISDAYLERIEKCKTGRVYILRFTSSDKKLFFWMQEPDESGDAEIVRKFNEAVGATIPDKKSGGAAAPAAAAGGAAAGGDVDPALRAVLQQFLQNQPAQGAARAAPLPLSAVLTPEICTSLMADDEAVAEMMTLLPEGHASQEGVREALTSPQLQQSLRGLTQAIHSDQLPVLLASLGLDPSIIATAAPGEDALAILCRAMQAKEGPQ